MHVDTYTLLVEVLSPNLKERRPPRNREEFTSEKLGEEINWQGSAWAILSFGFLHPDS